nr:DUF445 family protein [Planctomycetota bacterium]
RFGNALHHALEHARFQAWRDSDGEVPTGERDALLVALRHEHYREAELDDGVRALAPLIARTLNAPLPTTDAADAIRLCDLADTDRIAELEFHFTLRNTTTGEFVALLQRQLSGHAQVGEVVAGLLGRIGGDLEQALADPASTLSTSLAEIIESSWTGLQADPQALAALDRQLVEALVALVDGQRPMLHALIVAGLARHSDAELVRQIEGRIGDDLQYIRLNGAVVGGVVGVVLAVVGRLLAG